MFEKIFLFNYGNKYPSKAKNCHFFGDKNLNGVFLYAKKA